ncbi:MAG: response regulator transcription factor [Bryobacterales bacterium]|nr:response regulator transcription factor [Bryobacterales bacterium]
MSRKVLIADDHFAVRQGLEALLRAELVDCQLASVSTQAELVERLGQEEWDVVLLDLNMPGRSGLESLREIKDLSPSTAVLIYTAHSEEQLGVRALRAGADGFVTKDRPAEELLRAIRRVLEGRRYISETLAERIADALRQPDGAQAHELLSDREFQILRMLGGGTSATEIADQLTLSIKTVSTYRTRVLQKLNLRSTAELIRYAVEHNIR